jgi:MFS family permease
MIAFGLASGACYLGLASMQHVWQFTLAVALIYPLSRVGVGEMMGSANVNRWFVRRRGRAMGTVMMGASAGSVIFIPLCTLLIAQQGWRVTYAVLGSAAALLICLPAWLLLVDRPEALGLGAHPELKGPGASTRAAAGAAAEGSWSLREAARTRTFWLTLFGLMLGTIGVQGYFIHAVPHMEARGFSRALAGAVWSTFFLVSVVAKFLWGFVIERIGVRWGLALLFAGEGVGMVLLLTARTPTGLFVYAVLNGVGHAPFLQLQAMVWAEYFGRHSYGRIYGSVQPALVISASLGPWLGGVLFDLQGDYTRFFQIGIALCAGSCLVFLLTPPPRRALAAAGFALPT